jgi:hypothetical protein
MSYLSIVRLDPKPPSRARPPASRPGSEQVGPHPAELIAAERFLHRRLRNRLNDATDGHGLSYAQVEVMLLLEERTNLHAGQMARALGTSRQAGACAARQARGRRSGRRPIRNRERLAPSPSPTWAAAGSGRSGGFLDSTVHAALRKIPAGERRELLDALNRCERALAPIRPPWWLD